MSADAKDVAFKVQNDKEEQEEEDEVMVPRRDIPTRSVESLLACYPKMLHKNWDGVGNPKQNSIYNPPDPWEEARHDSDEDDGWLFTPRKTRQITDILDCFPAVQSALEMVKERCACSGCKENIPVATGKLGCLREAALDKFLLLVSHAIADSFGAPDSSGMWHQESIRDALCKILTDIIDEGVLLWDDWFRLVGLVYLGGVLTQDGGPRTEGSTALAAIQRGSLVIAASWLDLNSDIALNSFFKAEIRQGQLHGVCGDEAIVETEKTMAISEQDETMGIQQLEIESKEDDILDFGEGLVETALIGAEGRPYRLLTMARSTAYRRIVDPCDAVMAIHRSVYPQCSHSKPINTSSMPKLPSPKSLRLVSFDEVLGSWNPAEMPDMESLPNLDEEVIEVTKVLNTVTKFNVAVGLSLDGAVVTEKCCLECALNQPGVLSGTWNIINYSASVNSLQRGTVK